MSWSQFKDEVGSRMKEANWKTSDEWAKFFTKKYDECIKRGTDLSGKNPVLKGNTELMEQTLINAGNIALAAKAPAFYGTYLNLLGQAVIGYWSTATLQKMSTPLIPAPGTILNLQVTNNYCTNPGKFVGTPTPPTKEVDSFLSAFISAATIHLTTISGTTELISQYIPPLPIGPAITTWTGYKIEGASNRRQRVIAPIEIDDPPIEDDTPIVEGKAHLEHERRNGRVKFNRVEDAEDPELIEQPKRVLYKAPEPVRATTPAPQTTAERIQQTTSTPLTQDVLEPIRNIGEIGRGLPPKAPSLIIYKNGSIDTKLLVPIAKGGLSRYGGNYLLEKQAADQFKRWKAQADRDGFYFTITSAYRDLQQQSGLKGGAGTVAKAGSSAHGLALAIDIGELFKLVKGSGNPGINTRAKQNSKLYKYLAKTGPQYGWYNPIRLADNFGVDECWHWEYWGYYKK
jgi:hypothetical protein